MATSYTNPAPAARTESKTAPAGSALVSKLERKHPHWTNHNEYWTLYDLLYRGGDAILAQSARFLRKRPKEVNEIYLARQAQFTYTNIIGTALGWYQAALFRKDPSVDINLKPKGPSASTAPADAPDKRKEPYTAFLQNCDRNQTTYFDFWRGVNLNLLLYKGSYICIDLPGKDDGGGDYGNLKAQKASGALDAYLVSYDPRQVINWDVDQYGNLNWVVIHVQSVSKDFLSEGANIDRWYYYDRGEYRIYERSSPFDADNTTVQIYGAGGQPVSSSPSNMAKLVDWGPHAMAGMGRVPTHYVSLPEGLHLANRAFLPSMAHINIENSYHWALFMANLPVPVINTDEEYQQTMSETALIVLPKDGKFGWSEPSGKSFDHSAKCLDALREDIYREIYLQSMGRSSSASASATSGYSKDMDWMPSKDVLAGLGDILRPGMQRVLNDVALVREDVDLEFDVRGFNFEISPALQEAETLEILMALDIPSDEFYKQAQKRVATAYLTDANRAIQQQVNDEIDKAPTRSEQQAAEQEAQKLSMDRSLNRAVTGLGQSAQQAAP